MGRRILWIAATAAVLSSAALAQSSKWSDPYDKALTAIKSRNWQAAADDLNKAIAADPKAQADKYVEGTYSEDYFPYYYLGLAYQNLGQFQKAMDNFVRAQQTKMSIPLMQALQQHLGEVQTALASQSQGNLAPVQPPAQPPVKTASPEPAKPEPPKAIEVDPRFATGEQQAEAFLAAKRYADAIQQFDSLKAMDPTEFSKRGLAAKEDEATRGLATANANAAAQTAAAARMRSQQLLRGGRDLAAQHKYADADAQYQAAVDADKTNKDAADQLDNVRNYAKLVSGGKALFAQGKFDEARAPLRDAESLDSVRFSDEGLDRTLADIDRRVARPVAPAPGVATGAGLAPPSSATGAVGTSSARPPLQDALVAYLEGDMSRAIQLLQPLAANDKGYDASGRAAVHAYLGVAYASSSLEARTPTEGTAWRQKAISEFQQAQAAQPGYTLSQRIISPKIQAMLDEARRSR